MFLQRHGPLVLFLIVLAEQLGLPLPAVPVLLAMGALVGTGRFTFATALLVSVAACVIADFVWYRLGRWKGARVLGLLCRISIEPDSCVRSAETVLAARGARALLFAKFVPGLSTVAPPVAGLIGMRPSRFLLWDVAGAVLWSTTYLVIGYALSDQIDGVLQQVADFGSRVFLVLGGALAAWLGWKYVQRRRSIRQLHVDRITPEELKRRIDAGEHVTIVDLRGDAEFEADGTTLPRAVRLSPERLDTEGLPAGEVVLFCT